MLCVFSDNFDHKTGADGNGGRNRHGRSRLPIPSRGRTATQAINSRTVTVDDQGHDLTRWVGTHVCRPSPELLVRSDL